MSIMEDFSIATFDEKIRYNKNPCRQKCGVRKLYATKVKKTKVELVAEKFGLLFNGELVDGFTEEQVLMLSKAPVIHQVNLLTGEKKRIS